MGKKKTSYFYYNIWNKENFRMRGSLQNNGIIATYRYVMRCTRWSWQRITRGYAECDKWCMYGYLRYLIIEMLQDMRNQRQSSPAYLGENHTNEERVLINCLYHQDDLCHQEWDEILDRIIYLWRESDEELSEKLNPYEEQYDKAQDEFREKYGLLGERLQTEEEREANRQRGGGVTCRFMSEVPEYEEISNLYFEERKKLEIYRSHCKDEAMDLLKEHFFSLWD